MNDNAINDRKICKSEIMDIYLRYKSNLKTNDMETTNPIRIPNPSKELVAFIEKAQQRKKERMQKMRERFLQTQLSKS